MATRDEIIDVVLNRLGNRSADTALRAFAEAELLLVQERLEGEASPPWFLLTERASASTTADEPRLPVPANFLQEWEEGALLVLDSTNSEEDEVIKDDYDALKAKYKNTAAGIPVHYALRNDVFWLFPTPDIVYTIYMTYFKSQVALTTNITTPWTTHASDVLIGELGIVLAGEYLHNDQLKARFEANTLRARNRLSAKSTAREEANRSRTMGDD